MKWLGHGQRRSTRLATGAALVLLLSCAKVMANGTSMPLIAWGEDGDKWVYYSEFDNGAWGMFKKAGKVDKNALWVAGANCPTRDETTVVECDSEQDIKLLIKSGGSWSAPNVVTTNCGVLDSRRFDVAYEHASGDLLLVYWDQDAGKLRYRTYNGVTLSGVSTVSTTDSAAVKWVQLRASPNSDEIIAVWMHDNRKIIAKVWNGAGWVSEHEITSNAQDADRQCFDAAYETRSGGAVVAFGDDDTNNPRFCRWTGATWTAESTLASVGDHICWVRLASSPLTDEIACVTLDAGNDVNAQLWNGSSWSGSVELNANVNRTDVRSYDVAYESGGGAALLVAYAANSDNVLRCRRYSGSVWGGEVGSASVGGVPVIVQLRKGRCPARVFAQVNTSIFELRSLAWNGNAFVNDLYLTKKDISALTKESFAAISPAGLSPADIPYFSDFESCVGAEWSDAPVGTNSTLTTFLGRLNKSPVELALNTVVGETYTLRFDFYAIDSWDPAGDTAKDALTVRVNGTEMFEQSFSQRAVTYPPTFPNPAKLQGHYGYDGAFEEGVYDVTVSFVATAAVTTISFEDNLDEALGNESSGFDNVSVTVSRFHDVSVAKGFAVTTSSDVAFASGLHWADYDNDGDLDAIVGGDAAKQMINSGAGAGFIASAFGSGNERRGAALLDVDNDGDVDFWSGSHNGDDNEACLFNDGAASFSDAGDLGFGEPNNNEGVAAADVDRDGWCDVVMLSENGNWIGRHQGDYGASTPSLAGTNAASYGLNDAGDVGNGDYVSSGDVNNDGYADFFYHWNGGKLFVSDGDGTYSENARGISVVTGSGDKFGSAWGDYDNDGDLDLFAARFDAGATGNLWRNDVTWGASPAGSFTDRATSAYVNDASGQFSSAWGDYDNDGDLDLYIATRSGPNKLNENQGDGTFRWVDVGAGATGNCQDVVFVDYDNDGDLDIAATREDDSAVLLENRTNDSNYLKVRVIGLGSGGTNVAAVGIRLELWNQAGTIRIGRRDIGVARGIGTEPLWAHFGGIDPAATYILKVFLHSRDNDHPLEVNVVPQNVSTTIGGVTIPQMITVTEPAARKRILQWREVPNRA